MWCCKSIKLTAMLLSKVFIIFLQFATLIKCDASPSVIIVGAGAAGIAAASRLLENNITNITILEAEGRIGGRIHSVQFGDAVVDLGAQWCHGVTNNIVYELVEDLNLLEPTEWSDTFYHSSREQIDQNLAAELMELFHDIYFGEIECPEGTSLGDYFVNVYNKSITEHYGSDPEKLKFASEFLNFLKLAVMSPEGAFSWLDPSAKSDFEVSAGNQTLNWKGRGYKTILDVLMKIYPNPEKELPVSDKIIFNKEVTKITWDENNESAASVQCLDDSVHKADHIILTTSLGVLKDGYSTLFHPQLPQEKIDAIKELGIAAVVKMFFHFPQRWWPTEKFQSIEFFWSEKDRLQFLLQSSDAPDNIGQSWLLNLIGLDSVEKNPNVLEAWFAGECVPEIELFSDDKIIDGVMFILKKFVGHQFQNLTNPDAIVRHSWYADPHFRGTYSYQTIESRRREISGNVALSKPLTASNGKQTLLFAGEATSPTHYSTVHGAIETGFREAGRIIDLYK